MRPRADIQSGYWVITSKTAQLHFTVVAILLVSCHPDSSRQFVKPLDRCKTTNDSMRACHYTDALDWIHQPASVQYTRQSLARKDPCNTSQISKFDLAHLYRPQYVENILDCIHRPTLDVHVHHTAHIMTCCQHSPDFCSTLYQACIGMVIWGHTWVKIWSEPISRHVCLFLCLFTTA